MFAGEYDMISRKQRNVPRNYPVRELNNNVTKDPKDTVVVHVTSRPVDDVNTKAEFLVTWENENVGNKTGIIIGELAIQRADLAGLQKVLEQASQAGLQKVHIKTDSKYLIMVNRFRGRWKSHGWTTEYGHELLNKKMIVLVDALIDKFQKVTIELVRGPRNKQI